MYTFVTMKSYVFFHWFYLKKEKLGRPRKAQDRDHHPHSRNKMLHAETEDIIRPP